MGLNHSPRIITNGLVLALDAGNAKSYSGSGTTWIDLSKGEFNATSFNSPSYSASGGGFFTLNGSTQYFTVSGTPLTSVTTCTILMWIYSAASQANYTALFFNRNGSNVSGMNFFGTSNKLGWHWNDNGTTYSYDTGLVVTQGIWSMVAMSVGSTSTTFWVNSNSNTQTYTTATQTFDAINIGRDSSNGRLFNGRIGVASLYNRALTADEIQQNFNAIRGRFGV